MTNRFLDSLYRELDEMGLGRDYQRRREALPIYERWAPDFLDRLPDYGERRSFLSGAAYAVRDGGRDAESARFWIQVFKECLDREPRTLFSSCWQLMDSIGRVATDDNFEELASLTEDPFYIQCMAMCFEQYFAKSKDPRVPEVLRRLMEPGEIYDAGRIMYGAQIAANRKFLELIPTVEKLLTRLKTEQPEARFDALEDALYRLYRARYIQELYAGGKAKVDISRVLADLDVSDAERAAFAAYALGDVKAVEALGRLRELTASSNVRLRREAKAAVKKLEKASALPLQREGSER
ncbi:hypothetical protein [uncultured Leifsonia sp.]|uniref:hypothetical protein n=1 Tax=uncultured Leifsonia sp. TaxID=340359 RepID=UPI0028D5AC18|nr:hypothetical protein [uncultured Leifsonia sp.]